MPRAAVVRESLRPLRNFLEHEVLKDCLGTFASTGCPAIWVEPPWMADREDISGVACIIARHEKGLSQEHVVSASQALQTYDWEVVIRAYDRSAQGLVLYDCAIASMRQTFSQMREIMSDMTEDVLPQVRYLLRSSRLVNLRQY